MLPRLQIFHQILALFVASPAGEGVQIFNQRLCNLLHQEMVEAQIPTPSLLTNLHNGGNVCRRTIKATCHQVVGALNAAGVAEVFVAQYGSKTPLDEWMAEFKLVFEAPMKPPVAYDPGWSLKDPQHIFLFRMEAGRQNVA